MSAKPKRGWRASGTEVPNNLPLYLTSFVAREGELAALKSMFQRSRMVTLTGPGGAGKSRLAAEVARSCIDLGSGAVWWVELAPVDDPRQVPGAVVAALELPGRGPAQDVATAWLASKRALLILDNCEHLISACAEFCQVALRLCPELTILATSREPLGVTGEAQWPVASLRASHAVQLFEARARMVRPQFRVTATNCDIVTNVCERLDGIPLAIELAAARAGMLTEQEILAQLSDRFHLLTGGHRTAPERQKTMLATIDWSYRLLTDKEAHLFRRLSVFRGGFTLEGAHAVCGEGISENLLDLFAGLVQKSMLVAEQAADSGSRYRLLESQLVYAEDRLRESGELGSMRRRHYEYFLDHLEAKTWTPQLLRAPPGVAEWQWMARESANLWAAMGWARNNADDLGLSLAVNFWFRDSTQARSLLADLLAHSPPTGMLRVRAQSTVAYHACAQGDFGAAREAAQICVSLAREMGDVDWVALALNSLGWAHMGLGELAAAVDVYEEATALLEGSGSRAWIWIRNSAGLLAIHMGDYAGASDILAECVAAAKAEGDVATAAACLDSLACAQLGLNDHHAAAASWNGSLNVWRGIKDNFAIVSCLEGLSCAAGARGDDDRALRLAAAASQLSGTLSLSIDAWLHRQAEASNRRSRSRLGPPKSEQAWDEGWAMSLDQAIEYALSDGEPETEVESSPLSRREREVARLVAAGMTNRQIGERLFIAERTAEGHVERMRNKLGLHSRAHLAAWVVEHRLALGPNAPSGDLAKARETRKGPLSPGR